MSNEKNIMAMQLQGPRRESALKAFAKQIDQWGLTTPPGEPLVMDFGWGDFDRVGLIEYWIANEIKAGYCGKYMFLFAGQGCPFHSHQDKHETFFIVKGRVKMVLNGQECEMNPGEVLAVRQGEIHSFSGITNALLLELSKPCMVDDNNFEEPKIAQWLKNSIQ